MKYIGCCLIATLIGVSATAAVPAKSAGPGLSKLLVGEGITFGGIAGAGFTLKDFRRTADVKKKIERIVMDVGDRNGADIRGWPGYYHIELKKNPRQLIIDFAQMPNSRINQKAIALKMKNSMAVSKTSMSLDPVDGSLNLTMDLKTNAKVKVYQVAGKKSTSKVVVDLIVE